MNKQEKLIAILLGLALAGWLCHSIMDQKKQAAERAKYVAAQAEWAKAHPEAAKAQAAAKKEAQQPEVAKAPEAPKPVEPPKTRAPEKCVTLANDQMSLVLSSHGAVVKSATMLKYAQKTGAISADNPALVFDFADAPALALEGVPGLDADADWTVKSQSDNSVTFGHALATRTITLKDNYQVDVEESFNGVPQNTATHLSLGAMALGASKNDMLSIDSWLDDPAKPRVCHWGELDPLKGYLAGGGVGGCSGKKNAAGIPVVSRVDVPGKSTWVAVKNRFFVTALVKSSDANTGFRATMTRDASKTDYVLKSVSAAAAFPTLSAKRAYTLYIGPKKQSLLWDLGMKDVMEFGMWRWLCYPLVWILNACYALIPNFGIGIILLTILVRVVFWPLTHKSTVGMRRMQEIQPLMKEIQSKYKGNPQRLQQETWQLYKEHKVNPMSSCLPMLVQIPVFIALFTVLRSAVELRYAPFLWIADLSEPEGLFSSWFPFGGLNILPILMAGSMVLQTALSPSSGDKKQQQMMMVMMPIMMLFMFYSFPSALSLYWTLSNVFSIVQTWWIRKKYGTPGVAKDGVVVPDAVEMPQTRQMRRHQHD